MRSIYNLITHNEKYFLYQNIAVSAANLTLADMISIAAQIVSIIVTVTSTVIMADNHFKIFKKTSLKKNAEKESAQVDEENRTT